MAVTAECPGCGAAVLLKDDVLQGEIVECPDCGLELEVVGGDPWSLIPAPEVDEDWGE
ncbi:MAG TPA: lysine biosynthesis protein LysW [Gemmatimonadales bacterium]